MKETVQEAIAHMASFDRDHPDEAVEAARAIGTLGVEALCAALLTPAALNVPRGRHALKDELARQDPDAVAPTLLEALAHPDWRPNQVACDVIALMAEGMIPHLISFLQEPGTAHGRINAILILRRMNVTDAVPALARIADSDSNPEVRAAAVEALGWMAGEGAGPAIVRSLHDESAEVRLKAVKAAGWIRAAEAVDGILAFLDDADAEGRAAAVYALDRIGARRASARVVELLDDADPYVRWSAAVALRRLWTNACRSPLEAALGDEEETVAVSALETLCIASPQVDDVLRSAADDPRPAFRRTAACYKAGQA